MISFKIKAKLQEVPAIVVVRDFPCSVDAILWALDTYGEKAHIFVSPAKE